MTAPRQSSRLLLPALSAVAMLGSAGLELAVPCLPSMRRAFHASIADVQLTVASYAASFSLGTLLGGFLADGLGARLVLLFGVGSFCVASVALISAEQLGHVIAVRAAQGGAIGMASVCTQVLAAASYVEPTAFARASGRLQVARQVSSTLSPAVGAYLEDFFGWRSTSIGMLAAGLAGLVLSLLAPLGSPGSADRADDRGCAQQETAEATAIAPPELLASLARRAFAGCAHARLLLASSRLTGLVGAEAASFSAQNLIFVTAPHFLRGTAAGLSTGEFALAYALIVFASVSASEAFHRLMRAGSSPVDNALRGAAAQLCGAAALLAASFAPADASPWLAIIAPAALLSAGRGLVAVHTATAVTNAAPGLTGAAVGLMFCMRNLTLSAVIALTGATYTHAPPDRVATAMSDAAGAVSRAERPPLWPLACIVAALELCSLAGLVRAAAGPPAATAAVGTADGDADDGLGEVDVLIGQAGCVLQRQAGHALAGSCKAGCCDPNYRDQKTVYTVISRRADDDSDSAESDDADRQIVVA